MTLKGRTRWAKFVHKICTYLWAYTFDLQPANNIVTPGEGCVSMGHPHPIPRGRVSVSPNFLVTHTYSHMVWPFWEILFGTVTDVGRGLFLEGQIWHEEDGPSTPKRLGSLSYALTTNSNHIFRGDQTGWEEIITQWTIPPLRPGQKFLWYKCSCVICLR